MANRMVALLLTTLAVTAMAQDLADLLAQGQAGGLNLQQVLSELFGKIL